MDQGVDFLMGGGGGGQSLGQIVGIEWRPGRIGGRKGDVLNLEGQTHIRRGRVSLRRGLFEGARRILGQGGGRGLWRWLEWW